MLQLVSDHKVGHVCIGIPVDAELIVTITLTKVAFKFDTSRARSSRADLEWNSKKAGEFSSGLQKQCKVTDFSCRR